MSANEMCHRVRRSALLSAAISSCLTMGAHAAQPSSPASSTTTEPLEEVIVTGFRASLADALQNKRESNQIIESVSAEDIGKFPDQNVAESLQRLPGISIDRSNGQGTKARIRGLDQNVTLLNDDIFLSGLELYTQGEGNVREADSLEGIPSELLGGIDVYKSPNASQSESGLGGIINLKTRSPFAPERHDAGRQRALRRQRRGLGAARRAGVQSRVQRAPGRHGIGVLRQAAVPDRRARRSEPRRLAVFESQRPRDGAAELLRAGVSLRDRS